MKHKAFLFHLLIFFAFPCYAQQTLEEFISLAYQQSPVLAAQENVIGSLAIDSLLQRAQYGAIISHLTDLVADPTGKGYGYDVAVTNGQVLTSVVSLDKIIPLRSQARTQFAAIGIKQRQARNTLRLNRNDLRLAITTQYIVAYGNLVQLQYNREILSSLQQQESIMLRLARSNVIRQTDYLAFRVSVNKQALTTAGSGLQYRSDLSQLRYLSGISDTTFTLLAPPAFGALTAYPVDSSVYYQQYHYDSLALVNQRALLRMPYLPQIKVHADAGYMSSFYLTPYKNFGFGLGATLALPLYDGRQRYLKDRQLRLQEASLGKQRDFFRAQYSQLIAQRNRQIQALQSQNRQITGQLQLVETLLAANRALLVKGQLDLTQFFMSLQNLTDLKNQQNLNLLQQWMLMNEIQYWTR
jgi:outer membrane protein TolC